MCGDDSVGAATPYCGCMMCSEPGANPDDQCTYGCCVFGEEVAWGLCLGGFFTVGAIVACGFWAEEWTDGAWYAYFLMALLIVIFIAGLYFWHYSLRTRAWQLKQGPEQRTEVVRRRARSRRGSGSSRPRSIAAPGYVLQVPVVPVVPAYQPMQYQSHQNQGPHTNLQNAQNSYYRTDVHHHHGAPAPTRMPAHPHPHPHPHPSAPPIHVHVNIDEATASAKARGVERQDTAFGDAPGSDRAPVGRHDTDFGRDHGHSRPHPHSPATGKRNITRSAALVVCASSSCPPASCPWGAGVHAAGTNAPSPPGAPPPKLNTLRPCTAVETAAASGTLAGSTPAARPR